MSKNLSPASALAAARKATQALLISAVLILLAGGGGLFLLNQNIASAEQTETAREAVVGTNRQIASRFQDTLGSYNETAAKLQYLEKPVPLKSYVPTLLQQLQSLAKTTQLTVTSVHPGPIIQAMQAAPATPAPTDSSSDAAAAAPKGQTLPYSTMNVGMEVDGSYAHIMRFLYDLPRFPKILAVQGISLRPGDKGALAATMTLTAYVFDPATDVSIVAQPAAVVGAPTPSSTHISVVGAAAARAIGTARQDAAMGNEQATGQGILAPQTGQTSPGAQPNSKGGLPNGKVSIR